MIGDSAMLLAAGRGERMRPLTLTTPKPLVHVAHKPIIAYGLERLAAAHVRRAVVNVHWLADQIEDWALRQSAPPQMFISDERDLLRDTGGGVAHALPLLGSDPFFVLNSDSFWIDGPRPALERLRAAYDPARMDALLLLCPAERAVGYDGRGDFDLRADGQLARPSPGMAAPYVFAGLHITRPELFAGAPAGAFSMNLLWNKAAAAGRLFGLAHDGRWTHVGTPDAIAGAEQALREGA